MHRPLRHVVAVILLMAGFSSGLQAQSSPDEFIRTISQSVLDDLKADRSLQSGDIERLNVLVERKVMPYVDFQRMTALAVGRNWRAANPEQQRALMQEFRRLLLLTYSGAVRQVNDLTLQVRPGRGKSDDDEIIVRTQVLRPGREPILIDYRMQKSGSSWKIFDLNIMGLWLVEHYRNQFAQVVSASGIDGLIQSLREKNQTLAMSGGGAR